MESTKNESLIFKISPDKVSATIVLNCSEEELEQNHDDYIGEILRTLHQNRVTEGIHMGILQEKLIPQREYVIASGTQPVDGEDAIVHYYPLSERKPTIRQDGKANYYEMNFIDEVKKGDWLGEKIPATNGIPGKTVTGEMLVPKKGRDQRFLFDRKTVEEVEESGKTILRALIDGVVLYKEGKIAVGKHLLINGDVGVETGNLDFDGSITIQGIIQPGYSVKATGDISVLGEMGLSGVREIQSLHGDILIKGGLFGQGVSTVRAGKNIYIKHANDCKLIAKEDIHIGYYSVGGLLKGRHILADEKIGKIIGGKVEAQGKVVAAKIGNELGRKTFIVIEAIDRYSLSRDLEKLLMEYREELLSYEALKRQLEAHENASPVGVDRMQYLQLQEDAEAKLGAIAVLDEKCKGLASLLEVKGEGELVITEVGYPETVVVMKGVQKYFTSSVKGSLYLQSGEIHFE